MSDSASSVVDVSSSSSSDKKKDKATIAAEKKAAAKARKEAAKKDKAGDGNGSVDTNTDGKKDDAAAPAEKKDKKEKKEKKEKKSESASASSAVSEHKSHQRPTELPEYVSHRIAQWDLAFKRRAEEAKKAEPKKISIKLPDGAVKEGIAGQTTPLEIASAISKKLAEKSVAAKVNGVVVDLSRPIDTDCELQLLDFDSPEGKHVYWHSSAHVLGQALELEYGDARLCIGPPVDEGGFYYDVHLGETKVIPDDFSAIEELIEKVRKEKQPFIRLQLKKEEALEIFKFNPFKSEIIKTRVPDGAFCTAYRCGPLIDLCKGPHVLNTGVIGPMKVTKASSAYWQARADQPSLQRVYGISFPTKKALEEYEKRIKEAEERDHRKVGVEQKLFFFDDISPGSCFFLPHGARLYNTLVAFIRNEYWKRGYTEVISPNMFNIDLWKTSGHYENYKENMFLFEVEKQEFGLKPMNCPGHSIMFRHQQHSYRELPLRYADFGVLHRNELSGALSGLTRVRRFQQDDAHIFCRPDQIEVEAAGVLDMLKHVYGIFGFQFSLALSTRPEKHLGDSALWDRAEGQLENVLNKFCNENGLKWALNKGDGAFYGPKIDIRLTDALGRAIQCVPYEDEILTRYGFKNHDEMMKLFDVHAEVHVAEYDPAKDRINFVPIKQQAVVESTTSAWVDVYYESREEEEEEASTAAAASSSSSSCSSSSSSSPSSKAFKLMHMLRMSPDHRVYVEYCTSRGGNGSYNWRGPETRKGGKEEPYEEALVAAQLVPNLKSTWLPTKYNTKKNPVLAWRFPTVAGFSNEMSWENAWYDIVRDPAFLRLYPTLAMLAPVLTGSYGTCGTKEEADFMALPESAASRLFFKDEAKLYADRNAKSASASVEELIPADARQAAMDSEVDTQFNTTPLPSTWQMRQKAFLQLYGFWLGDGSLVWHKAGGPGTAHVAFFQSKLHGVQWCVNRLRVLGVEFVVKKSKSTKKNPLPMHVMYIVDKHFNEFFEQEYKHKYARSKDLLGKSEHLSTLNERSVTALGMEMGAQSSPKQKKRSLDQDQDSDSPSQKIGKMEKAEAKLEIMEEWERSGKWFFVWAWKLSALQKRFVLEGLIWADGMMASWIDKGSIRLWTSSPHFRDEVVRFLIEAGYNARYVVNHDVGDLGGFVDDRAIVAKNTSFRIDANFNRRKVCIQADEKFIRKVDLKSPQPSWCVSLPANTTRRIIVRRQPVNNESTYPMSVGNCATLQLDFNLPIRFDLSYKSADDKFERPVMIHRAILGSVERMIAVLVEHTGGRWPFWLSPRQAIVVPVALDFLDYAQEVSAAVHAAGFFVDLDDSTKQFAKKIFEAQAHKYNLVLVVGAKEKEEKFVTVRYRVDAQDDKEKKVEAQQKTFKLPDLLAHMKELREKFQ